ncbi:MAG: MMPL family transporter, partial [Proteobacteria bacterium]|nr:MMPL family transporter [Pseudomonadota bacterium]
NFADLQYERGELLYRRAEGRLPRLRNWRAWPTSRPRYRNRRTRSTPATTTPSSACARSCAPRRRCELHLGGVAAIADDMIGYVRNDIVVFGTASFLLAIGMLGYIFRELRWVLIPVFNCTFITVGILGMLGLVGWKLTVISSNFLAMTLILAISINIHLIIALSLTVSRTARTHASQSRAWVCRDMASPCMYTSLTSIIGFGSLLSSTSGDHDFGAMMSLSLVLVYFVVLFTLVPALMVCCPTASRA